MPSVQLYSLARAILVLAVLFLSEVVEANQTKANKVVDLFDQLSASTLSLVDEMYADNAVLIDPIGSHKGRDTIKRYYGALYENVTSIEFIYGDISESSDAVFLQWQMKLKAKGLNKGREVVVDGVSHLEFNQEGKITTHQDYFDMGAFVYEHVPIVGWILERIKDKLKKYD